MPRIPSAGLNAAVAAAIVPGTTYYIDVNTADPGTTGASLMTGTTRAAIVFSTASGGVIGNTAQVTVATPGSSAASYFSIWTTSTSGTFMGGGPLASNVTATSIVFPITTGVTFTAA